MNTISRRRLLSATALALPLAALGACAISTSGTVTTGTLNVAKLDSYAKAAENFIAIPAIVALFASIGFVPTALVAGIASAISVIDVASGGSVSVSFDTAGVSQAFKSLLTDAETLLSKAQSVITAGVVSVPTDAQTAISALSTVVYLVQAMLPTLGARAGEAPAMGEAQALRVLAVAR